jgi:hypothetical protein
VRRNFLGDLRLVSLWISKIPFVFHVVFGLHTGRVSMFHIQSLGRGISVPHWLDWGDSLDLFVVRLKDGQ